MWREGKRILISGLVLAFPKPGGDQRGFDLHMGRTSEILPVAGVRPLF